MVGKEVLEMENLLATKIQTIIKVQTKIIRIQSVVLMAPLIKLKVIINILRFRLSQVRLS